VTALTPRTVDRLDRQSSGELDRADVIGDRAEQSAVALLALDQGKVRLFALGDVHADADHPIRLAVRVVEEPPLPSSQWILPSGQRMRYSTWCSVPSSRSA